MGKKKKHARGSSRSRSRSPRQHSSSQKRKHKHRRERSRSASPSDRSRSPPSHRHHQHHSSSDDSGHHQHRHHHTHHSRSSGKQKRSRRSRSSSYHRSRSRSRSRERRSRYSRSRSRDRKSRSRSRDRRSRSRSRDDRRREQSRSRSRSDSRYRKRGRRSDSRERGDHKATAIESKEPASNETGMGNGKSDITKEVPGYKNMTPAERVRAKLKVMLEKTSAKEDEKKPHNPSTQTIAVPDAADLVNIESENFKPTDFVSHRTTVVQHQDAVGSFRTSEQGFGGSSTTVVDPREYEPQIVELPAEKPVNEQSDESTTKDNASNPPTVTSGSVTKKCTQPVVDKSAKWLLKLQKMRQQFTSPPRD